MSPRPIDFLGLVSSDPAAVRAKLALHRNRLHIRSEKLRTLLSSRSAKSILIFGMPEWRDEIKSGFRRLKHRVDYGPINEDSFHRYDIVVPLSIPALEEARRYSLLQKIALPLPTAQSVRLCNDKYEFGQALIKAGFGQHIPKMAHGVALTPPYILKKRISEWGVDSYIILNSNDQQTHLSKITSPDYFCQELIPGNTEFCTHILFVRRRIIKSLNIKYVFDCNFPIKGQNVNPLKVVHRCQYLDLFAWMLRTIRFEGLCCVNYKVADGQPFLFEINPRFGGSLAPYFFSFVRHLR